MDDYKVITDAGTFTVPAFSHADAIAALNLGNPLDEIVDGNEVMFRFADGTEVSVLRVTATLAAAA